MALRKKEKPERPRIRRRKRQEAGWLIIEPHRLGMVSGTVCAVITMIYFLIRQLLGHSMEWTEWVPGVMLTFVVSYSLAGAFVLYILWVGEREIDEPKPPKKKAFAESETHQLAQEGEINQPDGQTAEEPREAVEQEEENEG